MIDTMIINEMAKNPPRDTEGYTDYAFRICVGVISDLQVTQAATNKKAGDMIVKQTDFLLSDKPLVLDLVKNIVNGEVIRGNLGCLNLNADAYIDAAEEIANKCKKRGLLP